MKRRLTLLAAAVLLALAAWSAWRLVAGLRRFSQIDACLDGGGCWVASEDRCEYRDPSACRR